VDLVTELARRAAVAIDNASLFSKLGRAERHLEAVFASVAEAITVLNPDGSTALANRAAAELLGYGTPDELAAADPDEVFARFIVRDEVGHELALEALPARRLLRGASAAPLLVQQIVRASGDERWLILRSSPVLDADSNHLSHVVNVFENITEVKRAELGETFMAEASRLLVSSSHAEHAIREIARLATPRLADWCAIDLVVEGALKRVAVNGAESVEVGAANVESPGLRALIAEVLATGRSRVAPSPDVDDPVGPARRRALLREVGARSIVVTPIVGAGSTIGAVTLMSVAAGRRLLRGDVAIAERLARRIGTAVERSRLTTERIALARTLQRALLPSAVPVIEGIELDARYLAAGELKVVGGDSATASGS
jgi:PAS domain S-box-containing protein